MSQQQEPIIDADAIEEENTSTAQADKPKQQKGKKKSRFAFYLVLVLVLAIGIWTFWTFSPEAQRWKAMWLHQQPIATEPAPQPLTPDVSQDMMDTSEDISNASQTPLFEPTEPVQPVEPEPIESATTSAPSTTDTYMQVSTDSSQEMQAMTEHIQQLSQHIEALTTTITQMQSQQLQWSQQQVRAQLFALLRQAASPQSSLDNMIIAWKSISFLPLLNQDKRDTAEQAFNALQETQQHIQQTETNIQNLIQTLASEIHPAALKNISQDVANVVDPYQQTDAFDSWLDWLKQQFVITKLDKHALELSDDPYADIKQLMTDLNQLKTSLKQRDWGNIGSLTALLYQLEQRGLEAEFSNESIANDQAEIRHWQDEAQAWMAQL